MTSGSTHASTRYPRTARVRARPEFDAVFQQGRRAANAVLALHHLADERPARLGLAVSRKVDPRAVVRNRIKRVFRDRFRRLRGGLPGGAYVIVARAAAARASGDALRDAFDQALRRLALPPSKPGVTMPPASPPIAQAPHDDGATSPFTP
ncbi:MAG: ribonuclease P protein component [Xanthomonadales bacterium]|nr:ribonuclease P protein component [Xanthomonadales bacterium]